MSKIKATNIVSVVRLEVGKPRSDFCIALILHLDLKLAEESSRTARSMTWVVREWYLKGAMGFADSGPRHRPAVSKGRP